MSAGPPEEDLPGLMRRLTEQASSITDEPELDEQIRRLTDQVQLLEAVLASQADAGDLLVQALADQVASGQAEALYGLRAASTAVIREVTLLQQAAADLPARLAPRLQAVLDELIGTAQQLAASTVVEAGTTVTAQAGQAAAAVEAAVGDAVTALREQSAQAVGSVDSAVGEVSATLVAQAQAAADEVTTALRAGSDDLTSSLRTLRSGLESASQAMQDDLAALQGRLEETAVAGAQDLRGAQAALDEAAQRAGEQAGAGLAALEEAQRQLTAARDSVGSDLQQQVQLAQEGLAATAESVIVGIEHAGSAFVADATSVTDAMSKVGESFVNSLLAALDDRDRRDALLEDRLTARIDRLTTRTVDSITKLTEGLAAQVDRLDQRDVAGRQTAVEDLKQLVEQVLSEPRGRLKEARTVLAAETPAEPQKRPRRARPKSEDTSS